jgi:hypothetical protein
MYCRMCCPSIFNSGWAKFLNLGGLCFPGMKTDGRNIQRLMDEYKRERFDRDTTMAAQNDALKGMINAIDPDTGLPYPEPEIWDEQWY